MASEPGVRRGHAAAKLTLNLLNDGCHTETECVLWCYEYAMQRWIAQSRGESESTVMDDDRQARPVGASRGLEVSRVDGAGTGVSYVRTSNGDRI